MPGMSKKEIENLFAKYKSRIRSEFSIDMSQQRPITSREYQQFKEDYMPKHLTFYESLCNLSEKILRVGADKKKAVIIQENIDSCHLNITPSGATSFAMLAPIVLGLTGAVFSFVVLKSAFFAVFFAVVAFGLYFPFSKLPEYIANSWRLKASNQMVLCIFYVVTYMRHTSNLELAVDFAAEHVAPPMALDLKRILWDVETSKYESVKVSLDKYLEGWKKYNIEFVESFHLIESSLYEADEERRIGSIEKALTVMLEETYEKMLHYAHDLKNPITTLHMMGIILPILGLVILPLVVSFMRGVKWIHIAVLYNIILPVSVYYMGKSVLSRRPTGYGESDISESNPELKKYRNIILRIGKSEVQISPFWLALFVGAILFLIGLTPVILHVINPNLDFDISFGGFSLLGYRESIDTEGLIVGPYGLGATLISFSVVLAFGIGFGLYYKLSSKNVIKIREEAKKLENEFASALFQLGNRMADGLPAEIAFGKVADIMEGTTSGNFFNLVSTNIRKLGMSVREAIFSPKIGALVYYPSTVISSSMKVLVESAKKGPLIASQALMNVSTYIKEIHRVDERLKDLLADILASMKSQISFLTPVIAGIVIGITSMVTSIIGRLGTLLREQSAVAGGEGPVSTGFLGMFGDGVPTYYFQIIVGIYVVQLTYILTILSNNIENGSDSLGERYSLGINLIKSTIIYCSVALIVTLIFNFIAVRVLTSTIGG